MMTGWKNRASSASDHIPTYRQQGSRRTQRRLDLSDRRKMRLGETEIRVVKKDELERRRDHERSVEIAHLHLLMDRYPEKVREYLSRSPNLVLTKQAA